MPSPAPCGFVASQTCGTPASTAFPADKHALIAIYPNPLFPYRYVVLNSSFTYRDFAYLAFTLGMTLLMSTLAVFFGDVVEMFQLILQSWFFLTPVMYPLDVLPPRFKHLMVLNPMYHLVELFRAPIITGELRRPAAR